MPRKKVYIVQAGPGDHVEVPEGAEKVADNYDIVNRIATLVYVADAPEGDPGVTQNERQKTENAISASGSNKSDGWEG